MAATKGKCAAPGPSISTIRWTDISPNTAYAAAPTDSDTGGRVLSLVIAPDNKTLYASTGLSGVWKSVDAGKSWSQSSFGMKNALNIIQNSSLAIDAKSPVRLM